MSVWQCLCDKVWTNAVSLHKSDDLLPHNICSAASLYLSDVLLRNSICATVSRHVPYVPLKYIYIYFFCAAMSLYRYRDTYVLFYWSIAWHVQRHVHIDIYTCVEHVLLFCICIRSLCWRRSYSHHIIATKRVHAYYVARNSMCAYIMFRQMLALYVSYNCQNTCACILCRKWFYARNLVLQEMLALLAMRRGGLG